MRNKIFKELFFLIFILNYSFLFGQINTPIGSSFPFGSNNSYDFGVLPTNLPTGVYGQSQDAADAYIQWSGLYTQNCENATRNGITYPLKRVIFQDGVSSVSQGVAFGMLLSAYAADKELFDGLYGYYRKMSNCRGFMGWNINGCTMPNDGNSASDADVDAALALIVASKQWPASDFSGPHNYELDARVLIDAILDWEIDHVTSPQYQLGNGDSWLGYSGACPGSGQERSGSNSCRSVSYQSPSHYKIFMETYPDLDPTWNNVVNAAYDLINANANRSTGLVTDWSDPFGNISDCNGTLDLEFGYQAIKNPIRNALDVIWFGDSRSENLGILTTTWTENIGVQNMGGGPQDGSGTRVHNGAFVAGLGAGMVGATGYNQTHINSAYSEVVNTTDPMDQTGYYGNTLRVMALFMMSGNTWKPVRADCQKPDINGSSSDSTICSVSNIVLDANVTEDDRSFRWYRNGVELLTETSSVMTATEAGVYQVVVDTVSALECSKFDVFVINDTLPELILPSDLIICETPTLDIEASMDLPGVQYTWSKDGELVGSTPLITIDEAGVYEVIASLGICEKSEILPVTSNLAEGINDTLCQPGEFTLEAIGTGNFFWYSDETEDDVIGTGNSVTIYANSDTTVYLQKDLTFTGNLGPTTTLEVNRNRPMRGHDNGNYLVFSPMESFIIESMKIPLTAIKKNQTANFSIEIRNNVGVVLANYLSDDISLSKNVSGLFEITFAANPFIIQKEWGENLRMSFLPDSSTFNGKTFLYENETHYSYPYEMNNVVSISNSVIESISTTGNYNYFFDWNISSITSCSRTPVSGIILSSVNSSIDTIVCDSFVSPHTGISYFDTQVINDTIPNNTGCDSIITYNVLIECPISVCDTIDFGLAADTIQGLTEKCLKGEWSHFHNNEKLIFSVKEGSNNVSYSVDVFVNDSTIAVTDPGNNTGMFLLNRSWNVNTDIPITDPVSIRFYYDQNEMDQLIQGAQDFSAMNNNMPIENLRWFKSVGVDYDTSLVSHDFIDSSIDLKGAYGTTYNGTPFIQFDDITSFSGGTAYIQVGLNAVLEDNQPTDLNFALENDKTNKVTVYPNPTSDGFRIELPNRSTNTKMTLFNSVGQLILAKDISFNQVTFGQELGAGVYYLVISSGDTSVTKKLIKR